jgi:hypothetical protein
MIVSGVKLSRVKMGGISLESFGQLVYDFDAEQNVSTKVVSGTTYVNGWSDKRQQFKASETMISGATIPEFIASYYNSLPAVRFLAANSSLLQSGRSTRLQGLSKLTIICVGKNLNFADGTSNSDRTGINASDTNAAFVATVGNGTNTLGQLAGGQDAVVSIKAMVFDGTQTGNANRLKVYKNKSPLVLTFTGTIPSTTQTSSALIGGSRIRLGNNYGSYSDCDIMRLLIYQDALSLAAIESASDLLNTKYSVY